jgi:N6-L-threonylcarbamoyladenine synthase
MEAA